MELSAKTLREAEFRERRFGGYEPEHVDAFLEEAAFEVDALLARVRQAEERAARAEQEKAAAETGKGDAEDAVRRTLVLAQRTADLAIAEAQQFAADTTAQAEEHAAALVAEVEAEAAEVRHAARTEAEAMRASANAAARATLEEAEGFATGLRAEAESEARAHLERIVSEAEARVASLEAERTALVHDVGTLRHFVEGERSRLLLLLAGLLERAQGGFILAPLPALERPVEIPPAPAVESGQPVVAEEAVGRSRPAPDGAIAGREEEGDRPRPSDDDPFLAELRRAVDEPSPLGPRDEPGEDEPPDDLRNHVAGTVADDPFEENHPFFSSPQEERPPSRFRRK